MPDLKSNLASLRARIEGMRPHLIPKAHSMLAARGTGPILSRIKKLGIGRNPQGMSAGAPTPAADGHGLMDTRFNQAASGYRTTDGGKAARTHASGFIFTE